MKKRGFTLIELLIVIVLIGILISISLVAFNATKKSARDARRKADLEQIRSALEMYRTDCGSYPATIAFGSAFVGSCPLAATYMAQVPHDPSYSTYEYRYSGSTNAYTLCAYLENGALVTSCSGNCGGNCGGVACNYKTCNP